MKHPSRALACLSIAAVLLAGTNCARDPQAAKQNHYARGQKYLSEAKYAEAAIEFQNAIKNDPQFGAAYMRLGETYEKQKNGLQALGAYVRAADVMPGDVEAQLRAANYLVVAGQFEDARTKALQVVAANPKNVEALILVGNASAGLNDLDRAIRELQEAQKLDPMDPRIYNNLGWFEALKGRSEQAERVFRQAVDLAPKSAAPRLALGNYLASAGRSREAEDSLREALSLEPLNPAAHRALGWLLVVSNRQAEAEPFFVAAANDPEPLSKFLLADYYVWTGRDRDAVRLLQELRTNPDAHVKASARLAAIVYRTGDRAQARQIVDEAMKAAPGDPDLRVIHAHLSHDEGKLNNALAVTDALIKDFPDFSEAHFARGVVLTSLERVTEAQKAFGETIRSNPRAVPARMYAARLHVQDGNLPAARQMAEEVLTLAPGNPAAQIVIAETMQAAGDFSGADRLVSEIVKKYPDWAGAHIQAARLAVARSDWARARQALDRLETLNEGSQSLLEGRVAVALGTRQFDDARARLKTALEKDPKNERTMLVAAQVYAATGDTSGSEATLKQLLLLNPARLEAYDQLGQLYARSGKITDAEEQFEKMSARASGKEVYALTTAAVLAHSRGNVHLARQRYERVLAHKPTAAVAANNLAWLYVQQGGNIDVALQLAQTAKAAEPDNPNFMDTLGVVLMKKDLWPSAVTELRDAAGRAPKDATIHLHLAEALEGDGKLEQARVVAARALRINPRFPEAAEARRIIDAAQRARSSRQ